jgi:DNA (cytosine-5)-methyltransferase 1
MKALDLFCCAGGATRGLQLAGYHVTGVDIRPQPHYCGDAFIQADAMELGWAGYDLIWASPPCQRYSECTPVDYKGLHPDLLPVVADRLRKQETPYIIENVEMARRLLRSPIKLCGSMFGLDFWRHRYFEIGNVDVFFLVPPCNHSYAPVLITGQGNRLIDGKRPGHVPAATQRKAMQIDWMTRDELTEAIPPAYSRFLAERIMEHYHA